eukprot:GHVU01207759.1.p1 GENE.GHVU01207759.1~~GHVU01207759.1.p1  ORF type:complete len:166 (+),score=6.90 GHVU01207759.1:197-694(+)
MCVCECLLGSLHYFVFFFQKGKVDMCVFLLVSCRSHGGERDRQEGRRGTGAIAAEQRNTGTACLCPSMCHINLFVSVFAQVRPPDTSPQHILLGRLGSPSSSLLLLLLLLLSHHFPSPPHSPSGRHRSHAATQSVIVGRHIICIHVYICVHIYTYVSLGGGASAD